MHWLFWTVEMSWSFTSSVTFDWQPLQPCLFVDPVVQNFCQIFFCSAIWDFYHFCSIGDCFPSLDGTNKPVFLWITMMKTHIVFRVDLIYNTNGNITWTIFFSGHKYLRHPSYLSASVAEVTTQLDSQVTLKLIWLQHASVMGP